MLLSQCPACHAFLQVLDSVGEVDFLSSNLEVVAAPEDPAVELLNRTQPVQDGQATFADLIPMGKSDECRLSFSLRHEDGTLLNAGDSALTTAPAVVYGGGPAGVSRWK